MNNPAAGSSDLANLLLLAGPPPSPADTAQLASYRRWLDQAYAAAGSATLRQLIGEVSNELHQLAAAGAGALDDLQELLLGAFESIVNAFEVEAAASA